MNTSRRIRDKFADRARDRLPHSTGIRRFGYEPGGMTIVEPEAQVVREVYSRYLDGESPRTIARWLQQGVRTMKGNVSWADASVRNLLSMDSRVQTQRD
jgi:site-specific DNA recombinase